MSKLHGETIRLPHPLPDQVEYLDDLIAKLKPTEDDLKRKIGGPKRRRIE